MVLKLKLDLFEKKSYSRTIGTQTGAEVVEEGQPTIAAKLRQVDGEITI